LSAERVRLCVAVAMLLPALGTPAGADVPAPEIVPEIFDVRSPGQGSSWITISWDSTVVKHDLQVGEIKGLAIKARKFQTIPDIYALGYTVLDLKPDTRYEFRVRAYPPGDAGGTPVTSPSIKVRTAVEEPREFSGLLFWPQRRLSTFPTAVTQACIEAHNGRLYVLEAIGPRLKLSSVVPETFEIEWTRDITPVIDEPTMPCLAPDMCVSEGKLWITWHVGKTGVEGEARLRQRLMRVDLPTSLEQPVDDVVLPGAPLEIGPSSPGRGTCYGSVASHLGRPWLAWTERWSEEGESHSLLSLAPYDARRGQMGRPITWRDGEDACPTRVSITAFGGDMVLLYSEVDVTERSAGGERLVFARFDGRRFFDVHTVRRLGRNINPRGVQLYDRFYFVYQSDANYPMAGGAYFDVALGRLAPGEALRIDSEIRVSALPYVTDMKYNHRPDITVLGNTLYTVCVKLDKAPAGMPGVPETVVDRGFGTFIGKITRRVGEGTPGS